MHIPGPQADPVHRRQMPGRIGRVGVLDQLRLGGRAGGEVQQQRVAGLRLAVRLVCILDVVFILAWVIVISMANDPSAFSRSLDPILYGIQFIGVLAALGTLLVLFYAIQSWSKPGRWVWAKLFDTLLALSCIAFTWFVWHWNLINFNLKY